MTERELSFQISRVLKGVASREASARLSRTPGLGFPAMGTMVFGINSKGNTIAADSQGNCYEITVKSLPWAALLAGDLWDAGVRFGDD